MVKYTDILKAVQDKLKSKFSDIEIVSESDVEEKIVRPSFMVALDGIKATDFMGVCADREMTIRIYYFSKIAEKNKIENLKKLEELEDLFLSRTLELPNFSLEIEDYDVNFPDKVLEYSMDISFSQNYEREDIGTELMEDMQINLMKEE